jgi:hypothetical protein
MYRRVTTAIALTALATGLTILAACSNPTAPGDVPACSGGATLGSNSHC